MLNRTVGFFVSIVVMGFIFMSLAVHEVAWFLSFGWIIGIIAISIVVALYPVSFIIRLLGLIVQIFALFLPIKVYTTLNELHVYQVHSLVNINPIKVLGQLFSVISVLVVCVFLLYWFVRRRWDLQADQSAQKL